LPAPGCAEAFLRYCRDKEQGTPGRLFLHQAEAQALELAAQLLKTRKENVAFVSSASDAINILVNSFPWNPGDEVIISDIEFPSNVIPWRFLKTRGVRVIVVPAEHGAITWDTVAGQISSRTRLVSLSLVSYKTGAYLAGVPALSSELKRVGAYLCIDATQALGRCPVSLEGVDYLVSSSFKWLMGPHGLGLVYLSPDLREYLSPMGLGWYSVENPFAPDPQQGYSLKAGAAFLSAGMPNFPSLYALRESLSFLLGLSVEATYEKLRPLVERLRFGFQELGCDMLTPSDPGKASGIVAFKHAQSDAIGSALKREGIVVWGGDGRVRASVHLYNDLGDIDRCLSAMASVLNMPGVARPR
jgi:cysteine desulfurase / selenocysteine lyase